MTREELAKEMACVLERNGGPPWEIIDKHNKELMYEYADVALKQIDRLEREARAGRELRDGLRLAVDDIENAKTVVSVCRATLLPTYDTATKETAMTDTQHTADDLRSMAVELATEAEQPTVQSMLRAGAEAMEKNLRWERSFIGHVYVPNGDYAALCKARYEAEARVKELEDALRVLYEETADYIKINHLGDVHHNQSMKLARAALGEKP